MKIHIFKDHPLWAKEREEEEKRSSTKRDKRPSSDKITAARDKAIIAAEQKMAELGMTYTTYANTYTTKANFIWRIT